MACNDQTPPCGCPDYSSTGCLDTYNTDCVKYTGEGISCLDITTGDTLTSILGHLEDVVCALSPTAYSTFDYSCLSVLNINTEKKFVENVSDVLCQILGSQIPGGITSLSTLTASLTTMQTTVNTLSSQTTLDCFEVISGIPGPTTSANTLFAAIQQVLCNHNDSINTLISLGGTGITANDSSTIDFSVSGTGNHTITADAKLSLTSGNSLIANIDGLYVSAPNITVVDTSTIDLTASGTNNHTIQAAVKVSANSGNQVSIQADGIFVPATSVNETDITANDSTTIDFTTSGTNNHTITASVKIDPSVNNIISDTGNGLYADGTTFALSNNAVTDQKLRDSTAYSVIGRKTGSTGDPGDIVATANGVLRRDGSGDLEFGTLTTSNIGNKQVTFAKLPDIPSTSILGRSSEGSGDIETISAGTHLNIAGGVINTYGRTLIGVTKFAASGTWTKPAGCNAVIVEVIAAGGGGGGVSGSGSNAAAAGGGGGGGFARNFITSGLGSTETVTVGTGGAAGASGNNNGSAGGNSSFGAHVVTTGGAGGTGMAFGTTVATAIGGSPGIVSSSAGTLLAQGGSFGRHGIRFSGTVALSGASGSSLYNGEAQGSATSGVGVLGNSQGAGGSGALSTDGSSYAGGPGSTGLVVVYEYS